MSSGLPVDPHAILVPTHVTVMLETLVNRTRQLLLEFSESGDATPLTEIAADLDAIVPATQAEALILLRLRTPVAFALGRWQQADACLQEQLPYEPDNPALHHDLGLVRFRLRDFVGAAQSLLHYFELAPEASDLTPYHALTSALHVLDRGDDAAAILDAATRRDPGLAFYRDTDFLDRQQNARDSGLPPLLLNTQFKSASMFIATRLSAGLGLPRCYITQASLDGGRIIPSWLALFALGGALCQEHLPPRPDLLAMLEAAGIDRLVVHTRDPRQSMISGIHHFASMFGDDSFEAIARASQLDARYPSWSFARQADHYLDTYFAEEAAWIAGWRRIAAEHGFSGRILLTNYEDFHRDSRAYFERLLAFYELPPVAVDWSVIEAEAHTGTLHIRKGRTEEWREVLSAEQIARANEMMHNAGLDPDDYLA